MCIEQNLAKNLQLNKNFQALRVYDLETFALHPDDVNSCWLNDWDYSKVY